MKFKKKQLLILIAVFIGIGLIFLVGKALRERQLVIPKAAYEVGDIFLQPESLTTPVLAGGTFNVGVVANIGDSKFNAGIIKLSFDNTLLEVVSCNLGQGFKPIAAVSPCSFDNNNGTLNITLESENIPGPTGSPIMANVSFKVLGEGTASVSFTQTDIAVDTSTGQTIDFTPANIYGGTYAVGTAITQPAATNTPTVTVTPPQTGEAVLRLSPAVGSYRVGQNINVYVYLDTGQYNDISAVDAGIYYDKSVLHATNVVESSLFPNYEKTPSPSGIDETGEMGKIQISGQVSTPPQNLISGNNLLFATITFQAIGEATSTAVYFDFQDGGQGADIRNDSNIISYSLNEEDVLAGVTNASYQILASSEVTPSPTPTIPPSELTPTNPPGGNVNINFRFRFQGVLSKRDDQTVRATLIGGPNDVELVYNGVSVASDELGIWTGSFSTNVAPGGGYIILIKGPLHLARKYCDAVPTTDSETSDYHCGSVGRINLVNGTNTLDFSNTLIYVGDLPPQDGVMNARDGAEMRLNLTKTDTDALSRADVNFDGVVNTTDYSLLIQSMQVRYDEER